MKKTISVEKKITKNNRRFKDIHMASSKKQSCTLVLITKKVVSFNCLKNSRQPLTDD